MSYYGGHPGKELYTVYILKSYQQIDLLPISSKLFDKFRNTIQSSIIETLEKILNNKFVAHEFRYAASLWLKNITEKQKKTNPMRCSLVNQVKYL